MNRRKGGVGAGAVASVAISIMLLSGPHRSEDRIGSSSGVREAAPRAIRFFKDGSDAKFAAAGLQQPAARCKICRQMALSAVESA